ncbi:methyl-accepting chemotaxis protein [Candidatus Symbiobacter mobilis]|uniref:Twitching motility protein PilJ n=1 Tax=Candidatus Symbiobacter mobilis CR TaxID=946483 RepID=U5N744_9BURK|nr:methyl-accepting chemotaxis protein [Candidatus Symbiobacter mobilis]AGX87212.1 twitching motility protein PilJ [Candidatus Symbiobacter mobilis CR]
MRGQGGVMAWGWVQRWMGEASPDSRLSLSAPESTLISGEDAARSIPVSDSVLRSDSHPKSEKADAPQASTDALELVRIPFLGKKTVAQHQRFFSVLLVGALLALAGVTVSGLGRTQMVAQQLAVIGQALMHTQRVGKALSHMVGGELRFAADLVHSVEELGRIVRALSAVGVQPSASGVEEIPALREPYRLRMEGSLATLVRLEESAKKMAAQRAAMSRALDAAQAVRRQAMDMQGNATQWLTALLSESQTTVPLAASVRWLLLAQRIAGWVQDVQAQPERLDTAIGQDLELLATLAAEADSAGVPPALVAIVAPLREQLLVLREGASAIVVVRAVQPSMATDAERLRGDLEGLQLALGSQTGLLFGLLLALCVVIALLAAAGLSYAQLQESRRRQSYAEAQRQQALRQEREAKRVNDANQAAILRLMNELQAVAEGDLTQEATVTEDITGAIADSVNYTVEELRVLVGNVQGTASRVAQTTGDVDATSTELLVASKEQLHEIRETGRAILDMARRINDVSAQAQASAEVARQSLQAAEVGLHAVQNSIGGMNAIRDQIQETSKRIKRLGESSQEIGEITELISDITEQTNVLALNAAIQAASAGDAGRGFSVVAEEVQRLAERSADATRQIAALVKAIQTDTQDAIGAMERSTQGVVAGARLSDNAGTALTEIDQVSRRLAEMIEQFSVSTSREASLANEVAGDIQHIFAVTEQTSEGTRSTAAQVRELSKMAEELRQSVARFRIA